MQFYQMLKLRKAVSLKDERISQLETSLLEQQRRHNDERHKQHRDHSSVRDGGGLIGSVKTGGGRVAELEAL